MTDYLVKRTRRGTLEFYDPLEEADEPLGVLNTFEGYTGDEIVAWLSRALGLDIHVEE